MAANYGDDDDDDGRRRLCNEMKLPVSTAAVAVALADQSARFGPWRRACDGGFLFCVVVAPSSGLDPFGSGSLTKLLIRSKLIQTSLVGMPSMIRYSN